ncbi:MAG TPA: hypothetical protein VNN77_03050 [candidate division Zixibacteria bacterium]|nr:hypothetical protein [candidate division Zixibacteria bacterium]
MTRQILIALASRDRLGPMIPYIERIARPGTRVVLLVRFGSQGLAGTSQAIARRRAWNLSLLRSAEGFLPEGAAEGSCRRVDAEKLSAEHRAFLAIERLLKKGIEITVDVYTGSLRSAVKKYAGRGGVSLILKRRTVTKRLLARLTSRWFNPDAARDPLGASLFGPLDTAATRI